MMLFFVGILEMLIVATWTKLVSTNHILGSGIVTIFNILIWYYVLQTIVADIQNWQLIALYAVGCALGTIMTTFYFQRKERFAKHNYCLCNHQKTRTLALVVRVIKSRLYLFKYRRFFIFKRQKGIKVLTIKLFQVIFKRSFFGGCHANIRRLW